MQTLQAGNPFTFSLMFFTVNAAKRLFSPWKSTGISLTQILPCFGISRIPNYKYLVLPTGPCALVRISLNSVPNSSRSSVKTVRSAWSSNFSSLNISPCSETRLQHRSQRDVLHYSQRHRMGKMSSLLSMNGFSGLRTNSSSLTQKRSSNDRGLLGAVFLFQKFLQSLEYKLLSPCSAPRLSPNLGLRLVPAVTELGLRSADREGVAFLMMVRVAITHCEWRVKKKTA